jgi:coenzyme F420 hydrogenase subunit beta
MSKPKEYSWMTKDRLMTYTFIALSVLAIISAILWWPVTTPSGWSLGLTVVVCAAVAVGMAVGVDAVVYKVTAHSPLNTMSAAVFGMIVALSYSLGVPPMATVEVLPLEAPWAFLYVALISLIGLVFFKKLQGLAGRKFVNPAAAAKLVVTLPFLYSILLPKDHTLDIPTLAAKLDYNGPTSFGAWMQFCFGNPAVLLNGQIPSYTQSDVFQTLFLSKFHGWTGGASSLAVIIVGIGLIAVCRRYIKWRITLSYLVTTTVFAYVLSILYGGDPLLRIMFHLFVGSSVFLAFFMATDPATTPLTYTGQSIFGVGLALITILLQTYAHFFGGSILALVIMNLTSPLLDNVGILRPTRERKEPKLPKAKQFEVVKTYDCIRCGACLRACCNAISPILIKEAWDKQDAERLMKLDADYCQGCGNCNFICPSRINLKGRTLMYPLAEEEAKRIEVQFLKGTADEDIGVYMDVFSAKSSIDGQDGGVATALLASAMQKGLFDAAVVVQRIHGYYAEAVIAENVDEIMKAKRTKYMRVRILSKLGELIGRGKRRIAIVGTPCEVRAARRIQRILLDKFPETELTIIGLFCFEVFDYEKLKGETKRLLGVDIDRAEKTQIKRGKYIVQVDGKEYSASVKELSNAVEKGCLYCNDFSAKYADVSIGSVGSDDGYSTVIVRSDAGARMLEGLDIIKREADRDEVAKLESLKKKRAKQSGPDC